MFLWSSFSIAFSGNGMEKHKEILKKCAELLANSRRVLFLTSAGMSADSNIPTFRDKDARNKFRNWVADGLVPAAEKTGEGRGTRRTYDRTTVFNSAILIRLAQLGMTPADLRDKLELIELLQNPRWQAALNAGQPMYMIGRPPSAKQGGFVLTEFTDDLKKIEALAADGVGYWVDVGTIHRELAKLFDSEIRESSDG